MLTKDKAKEALSLVIPSGLTRDMNMSDLDKLMTSYALIEIAQDDFLAGNLTVDEYLDLCNDHNVNIDSYVATVEKNVEIILNI